MIIKIHNEYLDYLNEKQHNLEKKNSLSKLFSKQTEDLDKIKEQVHNLKIKIDELNKLSEEKLNEFNKIMLEIPNSVSEKVPDGNSQEDNKVIKEVGKKKNITFNRKTI